MKGTKEMKPNRFKQRMAEDNFSIGHMISEFGTRGQAKMLEIADIDFVVIDREHTGSTLAEIADLVAWFKATDIAPFVRIPQIQYHFIARTLDVGALGLMVPNVKNADEARAIVAAAKYAPLGSRGVSLGAAHSDYRKVDPRPFMDDANDNTTIICQIESREGIDALDDIAAVAGVDVLWVGHFDLSQSMGIPGQFHNPEFLDALRSVIDAARKNNLGIGIQPGNMDMAREWMEMGFNVISYSADHSVYINAMSQAVADVRNLAGAGN